MLYTTTNMKRTIARICGDGMLLAIYIVLSTLTVRLTPNLQITFSGVAIIMAVVLYGLPDALLVALLGSFVAQLRSAYGLTITTPIWMIPPILRALVFGVVYELFLKKGIKLEDKRVLFVTFVIISGLVTTLANTGAIFLDAYIFEYPVASGNRKHNEICVFNCLLYLYGAYHVTNYLRFKTRKLDSRTS